MYIVCSRTWSFHLTNVFNLDFYHSNVFNIFINVIIIEMLFFSISKQIYKNIFIFLFLLKKKSSKIRNIKDYINLLMSFETQSSDFWIILMFVLFSYIYSTIQLMVLMCLACGGNTVGNPFAAFFNLYYIFLLMFQRQLKLSVIQRPFLAHFMGSLDILTHIWTKVWKDKGKHSSQSKLQWLGV